MVERVDLRRTHKVVKAKQQVAPRCRARQSEKFDFRCCRKNGKGWRNGYFFSRLQQKIYCGYYCWDIPWFAPRRDFLFFVCLFFFFLYSVSKKVGRTAKQLRELWVEVEGPEKQTNKQMMSMGKQKGSLYFLFFWQSCRIGSATGEVLGGDGSTWEVRITGKENRKPQSW